MNIRLDCGAGMCGEGRRRLRQCAALLLGTALLSAQPLWAQSVPDAGQLQRQLRDDLQAKDVVAPPVQSAPQAAVSDGPRVTPRQVKVVGATLLTGSDIDKATASFIGRELDAGGLDALAQAVSQAYLRKGYFARVSLPQQDLTEGTVQLVVAEGRFGKLVVESRAHRADPDQVASVIGARLAEGEFYSLDALERGLLLANDLPGVSADGVLRGGTLPGTSDLAVVVSDRPLLGGSARIDNGGSASTGRGRAVAEAVIDNATGRSDRLSMTGAYSAGMQYGEAGWTIPVGYDGLQAGISASYLKYEVGGAFADLEAIGHAATGTVRIAYPLIRTSRQSHWMRAEFDHAAYADDVLGQPAHRKRVDAVSLVLEGTLADAAGNNRYSLVLRAGGLDLSHMPDDAALDDVTANREGGFARVTASLEHTQRVTDQAFLRLAVSGQWAPHNLDTSEQFALGGPGGVRAYPVGEGLGDRGALANVELYLPVKKGLPQGSRVYLFADAGLIARHAQTWQGWAEAGVQNHYALFGAGAGLAVPLPWGLQAQAVFAAPIGNNKGAEDPTLNQDGSARNARGWFTLSKQF